MATPTPPVRHLQAVSTLPRPSLADRVDAVTRVFDADARTTAEVVTDTASVLDATSLARDARRAALVDLYVSTRALRPREAIDRVCALDDILVEATLTAVDRLHA